jgi:ribose transport system permease protein
VSNLLNVAQQTSINAIIAVGLTFVIITAGIDLSVGSILAFAGVVLAWTLEAGVPLPLALLVGLGVGTLNGMVNGFLIAYGRLPPFISTLGMMSVARGCALLFSDGRPISGFSEGFRFLATGELFYIPVPVIITGIVYIAAHFVLTRTKFGRYAYAIGGNEEAALLSGVNVKIQKAMVYGLSGLLSGLAAIILTARLNSAQPIAGIMYEHRCDCRDRNWRHQPDGWSGNHLWNAYRGVDYRCVAQRIEPPRRFPLYPAGCYRVSNYRSGFGGYCFEEEKVLGLI